MRSIVFRGKDKEDGRWYTGSYLTLSETTYCFKEDYDRNPDNTKHYIVFDRMTDWGLPNRHMQATVDPKTVGQYTGLSDKNGKWIFEGDILKMDSFTPDMCEVKFIEGAFCLIFPGVDFPTDIHYIHHADKPSATVIGNIHDNPELLEVML